MSAQKKIRRGFTLIELLITIAIIGILSAAVLVGINPIQKLNQANDSKAKSDVGQIATAMQSYFTSNQSFPTTAQGTAQLATYNELKVVPVAPTGYTYTYTACTTAPCTAFSMGSTLKAPVTAGSVWCFRSAAGVAAEAVPSNCVP